MTEASAPSTFSADFALAEQAEQFPFRALPILFRPCAWHETREELDRLNRAYPGQVSHGQCDDCQRRMLAEAGL